MVYDLLMNRRQVMGSIGAAVVPAHAAGQERERFIGVWRLISCERKLKDGKVEYPYGEKPVGRITYDRAGRMSATLMRPGRKSTVPPGVSLLGAGAGAEELRAAVDGFTAYFGKFDVDEQAKTVIHHVEAALVPSWVGTDLRRAYSFSGKRMVLRATTTSVLELVWERESD